MIQTPFFLTPPPPENFETRTPPRLKKLKLDSSLEDAVFAELTGRRLGVTDLDELADLEASDLKAVQEMLPPAKRKKFQKAIQELGGGGGGGGGGGSGGTDDPSPQPPRPRLPENAVRKIRVLFDKRQSIEEFWLFIYLFFYFPGRGAGGRRVPRRGQGVGRRDGPERCGDGQSRRLPLRRRNRHDVSGTDAQA